MQYHPPSFGKRDPSEGLRPRRQTAWWPRPQHTGLTDGQRRVGRRAAAEQTHGRPTIARRLLRRRAGLRTDGRPLHARRPSSGRRTAAHSTDAARTKGKEASRQQGIAGTRKEYGSLSRECRGRNMKKPQCARASLARAAGKSRILTSFPYRRVITPVPTSALMNGPLNKRYEEKGTSRLPILRAPP